VSQNLVKETPRSPWRSPTYPQRVHIRERGQWLGILESWDARIREAGAILASMPAGDASRPVRERLYNQMLGGRDQIADAAKRLPTEVGDLYEEDRHRLEEAVAALERIFARWK
jgi:hypothetical protein